ncbi:MAG: SDR family oxidoreductase [Firmicutes bacterium]|nr:SDR family oxidoreductase [Bacillota bacterium]
MQKLYDNKVVLITGGSSGLGKAMGEAFAAEGARVVLTARNEEKLAKTVEEISEKGYFAEYMIADSGNEQDVARVAENILKKYGRVDVLINNAGVGYTGNVDETDVEKFDEIMSTNVKGVFLFCKYIIPSMKQQKDGYIVNISSGAGKNGIPGMAAYCASKFAVAGFSEALAQEVRNHNVRVSVVYPGSINTDFHLRFSGPKDEETKMIMMQPQDIAQTVLHIVSQPHRYWIFDVTMRAFLRGNK